MTFSVVGLVLIGALISCGVYMLLERNASRMLMGLLLISNGINLLLLIAGGRSGNPPIRDRVSAGREITADPLAQAMVLTAIVITMGVSAFVLALAYRSYRLTTEEEIGRDPEDTRVSDRADDDPDLEGSDIVHPGDGADGDSDDTRAELDALPRRRT